MLKISLALPFVFFMVACEQAEMTTARAIQSDWKSYEDRAVQIEGLHVSRGDTVAYLYAGGRFDYLALEDESGRINVWFDVATRSCPPRLGAQVTVQGRVAEIGDDAQLRIIANSLAIDDEPPLADNEVRLCQLSLEEQQMYAMEGLDQLQDYWRATGRPDRDIVYD